MNINFITTNNVTNNTMHKFITILTSIFIIALLATFAGCDSETGNTTATTTPDSAATTTPPDDSGIVPVTPVDAGDEEKAPASDVSFEMPEGWKVDGNSAYLYEEPEDSAAGMVEAEVYITQDPKEKVLNDMKDIIDLKPDFNPTFEEIEIGGKQAYLLEERTNEALGDYWWSNTIAFEHDDWMVRVSLTDKLENRKEAIEKLIETLKINEE